MSTLAEKSSVSREPAQPIYGPFRVDERVLSVCGVMAAACIVADIGTPAIAAFNFTVWLIVPGWVLLRWLPVADPVARVVWTVLTSVVLATLLGLIMAWTGWWHPRPVAMVTLVAAAALIFRASRDVRRGSGAARSWIESVRQRGFIGLVPWLILFSAVLMWGAALRATYAGPLGDWGLLAAYPLAWFVAVGLVLAQCIWGVVSRRASSMWIMGASLTVLVVMLYASASLLTSVPRLPWVYKHIAVTDFIAAAGRIDPSIDIYNRWPGFFAGSAFMGEFVGYHDAAEYASWAEVGFALIDVLIVLAIARAISRNPRVYWMAALVFALTNWVGQNYFAPQAFAFTLYLTMCLTALTFLRGTPVKHVKSIERWPASRTLLAEDVSGGPSGRAVRIVATIAIIVLQAVIVVSHQLSPYMAVLGLLPLFVGGFFRPRWVGPLLLGIAIAYLLPNLAYVESTHGLFTNLDPVGNASAQLSSSGPVPEAVQWQEFGVRVLSGLTLVLACMGFVRQFLKGDARTALLIAWLGLAPAFTLVGQSYGGEGRLRVYLFALPWLAIGVAWLFWSGPLRTRKAVLGASASLLAMALLFTATYFQAESRYRVPEGDVIAAQWLDSRVQNADLVVLTAGAFPGLIGPNYPYYLRAGKLNTLEGLLGYFQDTVTAGDVEYSIRSVGNTGEIYVVFSDGQEQYVVQSGLAEATVLPRIESQLATTGIMEKVFDNGSSRIYQFVNTGM